MLAKHRGTTLGQPDGDLDALLERLSQPGEGDVVGSVYAQSGSSGGEESEALS